MHGKEDSELSVFVFLPLWQAYIASALKKIIKRNSLLQEKNMELLELNEVS